jgi:hypothetical protein
LQTPEQVTNFANILTERIANSENSRQKLEIANSGDNWRWQPVRANTPYPSISIIQRGANRGTILTISRDGTYSELYPSWLPVIEEWKRQHANGCKRISHSRLDTGRNA